MGNNINLTEGMLLHTSVLALVILAGGLLYRRVGIEAWRKDRHGWFMAAVLVLTLSIIVLWPVRYVAYLLFAHSDMVHARVAVIALFPLVALVAGVLDRWTGGIAVPTIWRTPLETAGIVLVAAGMVFLADRSAVASAPALSAVKFAIPSHLLDPPWTWFTAEAPRAPTDVSATRRSPDQARLSWRPVTGAMGYFVELGLNGGPSAPVGFAPAAARFYDLGSLDRTATYDLRLAACNVRGCSDRLEGTLPIEPGAVADMRDRLPPPVPGVPLPDNHLYDSHLRIDILVLTRVLILSCIAVGLMAVAALSPRRWRVVAGILGIAAVIDASTAANFQINGPQTRWVGPAFQGGNMMTAAAGEFRSPSEASLKAAAQRLETGAYRSVAVCSPVTFATFCAPHLSHFWNLRLLDGYTAGVPRGLAAVPWPDGVREMRSLTFRDADALAWRWLALFNVKYAILASRSLYTNGDARQVLDPTTIPVLENPLPVVPRLFFAAAAERVPDAETAITRLAAGTAPADPRRISYAVGLAAATYEDRGRIDGVFAADRVEIHLDPAAAARFLVINEQPHPGWQATADGRAIPVYSVNGAMRGVVVPAGATTVTLVFRPFAVTAGALPFLLASVGLLVAGIVVCRRGERLALPAS